MGLNEGLVHLAAKDKFLKTTNCGHFISFLRKLVKNNIRYRCISYLKNYFEKAQLCVTQYVNERYPCPVVSCV
jgi:hypothetical protein